MEFFKKRGTAWVIFAMVVVSSFFIGRPDSLLIISKYCQAVFMYRIMQACCQLIQKTI